MRAVSTHFYWREGAIALASLPSLTHNHTPRCLLLYTVWVELWKSINQSSTFPLSSSDISFRKTDCGRTLGACLQRNAVSRILCSGALRCADVKFKCFHLRVQYDSANRPVWWRNRMVINVNISFNYTVYSSKQLADVSHATHAETNLSTVWELASHCEESEPGTKLYWTESHKHSNENNYLFTSQRAHKTIVSLSLSLGTFLAVLGMRRAKLVYVLVT